MSADRLGEIREHLRVLELDFPPVSQWTLIVRARADLAHLIGEVEREKARADAAEAALATEAAAGFARGVEETRDTLAAFFRERFTIIARGEEVEIGPIVADQILRCPALRALVPS